MESEKYPNTAKVVTVTQRASHVNTGTSVPAEELAWPDRFFVPVMKNPKPHFEVEDGAPVTLWGGLALVIGFIRSFNVVKRLNDRLSLLKLWLPYSEADHVLALAFNLYIGGRHLEDMADLQQSEAVLRMTGACRLPDPTTAGDFLRRFDEPDRKNLLALQQTNDDIQEDVWKRLRKRRARRRKKMPLATVDLDGHIEEELGVQKQGADFSYNGKWGFQPLVISLAQTVEVLKLRNRPANGRSSDGVARDLDEVLPRLKPYFERILVRGDSDFDRQDIRRVCHKHGVYVAFVGRDNSANRTRTAMMIEEERWRPYRSRTERQEQQRRRRPGYKPRKKKTNRRRARARQRGYKEMCQAGQWVTEQSFEPDGEDATYRLVFRRQLVEHRKGQVHLFDQYRYWSVVTDLPLEMTTTEVIDETYKRCDQENIIEQLGNGVAAWQMPVAEYLGNCAWLEIARLAWNIGKWIALLALPPEVVRWEWKRFRRAFVFIAATVVKGGRQIKTRIYTSHRYWAVAVEALEKLQR